MSDEAKPTPADIQESVPGGTDKDTKAKRERSKTFEGKPSYTELRNKRFHQQSVRLQQEHRVRLRATKWVFGFVLGWLVFVGAVVLLAGVGCLAHLSEKVLIALLATTTVTVIGLLAAVVRYLFPPNPAIFGQDTLPTTRTPKKGDKSKNDKSEDN